MPQSATSTCQRFTLSVRILQICAWTLAIYLHCKLPLNPAKWFLSIRTGVVESLVGAWTRRNVHFTHSHKSNWLYKMDPGSRRKHIFPGNVATKLRLRFVRWLDKRLVGRNTLNKWWNWTAIVSIQKLVESRKVLHKKKKLFNFSKEEKNSVKIPKAQVSYITNVSLQIKA